MNDRRISRLWGAVLGFLAAFGGIGVLASGMRFAQIPFLTLGLSIALVSVIFALCAGYRGSPAIPVLLLLVSWYLWRHGSLNASLEALVYQLSRLYNKGYGWPVIRWSVQPLSTADAALALGWLGTWIALVVIWSVVRNGSVFWAVTVAFLPLVPCMVLTDTVPGAAFLYLQLLSILLLLLPRLVRRRNLHQGNVLIKYMAIPVAFCLGLLFLAMPEDSYTGQTAAQQLGGWFEALLPQEEAPDSGKTDVPGNNLASSQRVNLTSVGPKRYWDLPVMEVTAQESGTLYLRGTAYHEYRGTYWNVDEEDTLEAVIPEDSPEYSLTVRTATAHSVLYMPYYPVSVSSVPALEVSGRVKNPDGLLTYTVTYRKGPSDSRTAQSDPSSLTAYITLDGQKYILSGQIPAQEYLTLAFREKYQQLTESAKARATEILKKLEHTSLWQAADTWQRAQLICDYVAASASYDLDTPRMPGEETDFALWFLEEADTGYCVHFASAATVLLRAAGIPARYVTGYLVHTKAGEAVTVLQKNAHAWVECYIPGSGWVVLEPTPPDGIVYTAGEEVTAPTEAATTETTAETETQDTTAETTVETTSASTAPDITLPEPSQKETLPSTGEMNTPEKKEPFVFPVWGKVLLWIAGVSLALVLQWRLRVWLRVQSWHKGKQNAQALARYRSLLLYAKVLGQEPDPTLQSLALKAKFSQHRLTNEELAAFTAGLTAARKALKTAGILKRLTATLVLALH